MTLKQKGIQAEIKQTKPFQSVAQEAYISLQRTADVVMRDAAQFLKRWDISATQYNVLRILRGAGPEGLRCGEIGERMVTHDPDIASYANRNLHFRDGRLLRDEHLDTPRDAREDLERLPVEDRVPA